MLSIELNDAGLILARSADGAAAELLACEPGAAQYSEGQWLTGQAAAAQSRLRPQLAFNRHWHELSAESLQRGPEPQRSAADLAYLQFKALLALAPDDRRLLLAVPASYQREQLGLLLGVAVEAGASEIGLVDAALAACALSPVPAHVVHLEIHRHQALVTCVEQAAGGARRARYESDADAGLQRLEQLWLEAIGAEFVRRTRFDPLHHSASEQQLLNGLAGWLEALKSQEAVTAGLQVAEQEQQVELARGQLLAAAEPVYAALTRLVQRARPAGQPIELRVGATAQRLPGLVQRLGTLGSCTISELPAGAAAIGALRQHGAIFRGADTALVGQLPLPHAAAAPVAAVAPSAAPATHVVFASCAWPLTEAPLLIGTEADAAAPLLRLPAGIPGVSRRHCRMWRGPQGAMVEDLSTYGTYINDERVHGSAPLRRGDRLRLGTPGVTLELIELKSDA